MSSLNAELQERLEQFTEAKREVEDLLAGLTEEQFNWKPGEKSWSVGDCIEHLRIFGAKMAQDINKALTVAEKKGWRSEGPFKYGPIGNWFVRSVGDQGDEVKRKFPAPASYSPSSSHSLDELKKSFIDLQDQLAECVQKSNGMDLAKIKIPSPALPILRLSLGQWFALLTSHQKRHFNQARRVRRTMEEQEQ